jgi:hypothetical protein
MKGGIVVGFRKSAACCLRTPLAIFGVLLAGSALAQGERNPTPDVSVLLDRCIAKIMDTSRRLDATSQPPARPPASQCTSNTFRAIIEKVVRERLDPAIARQSPSSLDCEVALQWRLDADARLVVEGEVSDRDAILTLLRDIARALPGIDLDDTGLRKLDGCLTRITDTWYVLVPPERNSYLLRESVRSKYQKYINSMPTESDCPEIGSQMEQTGREDSRDSFWVQRAPVANDPVDIIACKPRAPWRVDRSEDRARIIVRKTAP